MRKAALVGTLLALVASPALAHPGHSVAGLSAGFVHPFTGLDHLLVMVAVGLWAGLAGRTRMIWPATFVGFMLAGFAVGAGGGAFPGAEAVIVASVVAMGLAIGLDWKPPAAIGAAAIAVFAAAHGYAHGQEAPAGSNPLLFAAGFALATTALHLAGLSLAWNIQRWGGQAAARAVSLGVAATGLAFALV